MSCGLSLNYICSQAVYQAVGTMLWVLGILCPGLVREKTKKNLPSSFLVVGI